MGTIRTLGSRSRAEMKKIEDMGGRDQRKEGVSIWKFEPSP